MNLKGLLTWPLRRLRGDSQPQQSEEKVSAHYDVGHTSVQDAEHWGMARPGDAQIAFHHGLRYRTRQRARYEAANNCHLRGMVNTRTSDTLGDGPTLQMLNDGQQEIEREWAAWSEEVQLKLKLNAIWSSGKMIDGEGIGLLVGNDFLESPVKIDLMVIESEQMGNPFGMRDDHQMYDGIRHDRGFPTSYYIYDYHPEAHHRFNPYPYIGQWYDPSRVIHLYRSYRAGQLRGATELGPALPFAAILRRYTLATLASSESAAETSMIMETDATADAPSDSLDLEMEYVNWHRNQLFTAPYGWKVKQLKAEQPVDTYDRFLRSIVVQMGRSIDMPAVLSYGDASDYNMASGRLDVQAYIRSCETDRSTHLQPACMEKVFRAWLSFFLAFRSGMSLADIDSSVIRSEYPHRWTYRPINHSDPEKQASADATLWELGLLTDVEYLYMHNRDPEAHYRQLKRQNERRSALGMRAPGMMPGMPTAGESGKAQTNVEQQSSGEAT